jgi:tetratricopeptide (TPR) repeat protein
MQIPTHIESQLFVGLGGLLSAYARVVKNRIARFLHITETGRDDFPPGPSGRFFDWAERTRTFKSLAGAELPDDAMILVLRASTETPHPLLSRIARSGWALVQADPHDEALQLGFAASDLSVSLIIADGDIMSDVDRERLDLLMREIVRVIAPAGVVVLGVPACSDVHDMRSLLVAHGFTSIRLVRAHIFDRQPKIVAVAKAEIALDDLEIDGDVLAKYPCEAEPKVFTPRHCTGAYDRHRFGHEMLDHGLFDTFPEDDMEGEGKHEYNKGVICYERGDVDEAAACFRAAIDLAPGASAALNNLAICHIQRGRIEEGLAALLDLDRQSPDDPHVLRNIAVVYMMRDDNPRALEYLQRASELDPENHEIEFFRATIHERDGDFEQAMACMRRVLESDPDSAPALDNLGALLFAAGRYEEAIPLHERACELEPQEPSSQYNLAKALAAAGRFDDAIERFELHLELAPDHSCAICELAGALSDAGRHEEAVTRFHEYLELEPDDPNGHGGLGIECIRSRKLADAERHLREAYRLEPHSARVVLALGSLADSKGRLREALALYRKASERDHADSAPRACLLRLLGMKIDPRLALEELRTHGQAGDAMNYWSLAGWLESSGDRRFALDVSSEMVRKFPDDHRVHGCHGLMLEAVGQRDASLEQFKLALKLNPEDLVAHFHSGRILCESNRFAEGIPVLEYVIQRSPDSVDAMRLLAWAHSMIGERQHGRVYARRVLAASPEDEFARKLLDEGKKESE